MFPGSHLLRQWLGALPGTPGAPGGRPRPALLRPRRRAEERRRRRGAGLRRGADEDLHGTGRCLGVFRKEEVGDDGGIVWENH